MENWPEIWMNLVGFTFNWVIRNTRIAGIGEMATNLCQQKVSIWLDTKACITLCKLHSILDLKHSRNKSKGFEFFSGGTGFSAVNSQFFGYRLSSTMQDLKPRTTLRLELIQCGIH